MLFYTLYQLCIQVTPHTLLEDKLEFSCDSPSHPELMSLWLTYRSFHQICFNVWRSEAEDRLQTDYGLIFVMVALPVPT